MTAKIKRMSNKVIVEKHLDGPLKGKASKWYWSCSVCDLVYIAKYYANFCCGRKKNRPWMRDRKPNRKALGKMVEGEFVRFSRSQLGGPGV